MEKLKNSYFGLRHGRSEANEAHLIVSKPENGVEKYGLAEAGGEQVEISAKKALAEGLLDSATVIISSDFLRTKQTAELASKIIRDTETVEFDIRLRERNFGNFESKDDSNYEIVRAADLVDPYKSIENVESVENVLNRVWEVIMDCEAKFSEKKILLVSHGDPLQILSTRFMGAPMKDHRKVALWSTGEIRKFGN